MNIMSKKIFAAFMAACLIIGTTPLTALADTRTFNVSTAQDLADAQTDISTSGSGDYIISFDGDVTANGLSFDDSQTTVTVLGNGHTFTLENGGKAFDVWNGATVNLGDKDDASNTLTVIGRKAEDGSGLVYINENSTVNMYAGTTLKNAEGDNCFGGGVTINARSTFNMNGGTIENCGIKDGSVCYGGGVAAISGSTFVMNGGTIKDCYVTSDYISDTDPSRRFTSMGGGVYVSQGSFFQMNGGTIKNCSAYNFGGGVALDISNGEIQKFGGFGYPQSRVEINGGTIDSNHAAAGAGVFASGYFYSYAGPINSWNYNNAIDGLVAGLVINGGTISNNATTGDSGGGVFVAMLRSSEKAEIHNATITGNSAYDGGGIENFGYWTTMDIAGCTITDNESETNGGGVMASNNSSGGYTTIRNCTITDNTSGDEGAGVYYDSNSIIKITGANKITDNIWNKSGTQVLNNLNILSTSKPVYVSGSLEGSEIGVTDPVLRTDESSETAAPYLTSGYKNNNGENNPSKYFVSDHKGWVADYSVSDVQEGKEVRLVKRTEPKNTVYLTTKDSVDINFVIDADYYTRDPNATVKLRYNHNNVTYTPDVQENTVKLSSLEKTEDGRYKVTITSAPAQLTEEIEIKLYDTSSNEPLYNGDYSMWKYCDDVINNAITISTKTEMSDEVKTYWEKASEVCKALTDYATIAQVYFNYNKSDMASKNVEERQVVNYTDSITNQLYYHDVDSVSTSTLAGKSGNKPVARVTGELPFEITETTLMSLSNTEVLFYYEDDIDPADYTLSITAEEWYGGTAPRAEFATHTNNETGEVTKYIRVYGIESSNLDNPFRLTISGGGKTATIEYNALAYCYTVLRDSDGSSDQKVQELRQLVKSVYLYNHYAEDYFSNLKS